MSNLQDEIRELKQEVEELSYEVLDTLSVAFYFAGVKKNHIKDALDLYIKSIDEVFEDEDGEMGMDEIIEVINYIKNNNRELFS